MQRSGRLFETVPPTGRLSSNAQFLAVIEHIKSRYKEEYHSKFNGHELLHYIRRRKEIYKVIDSYDAFCAFTKTCRENGLPSVQGIVATELDYCLILDSIQMDMGNLLPDFRQDGYRAEWDNYRSFLHNRLFAYTENGTRMRFAVAKVRLSQETRKSKDQFNNEDLLNFFKTGSGFRYIYECEGEDSIFMKFCHYLVSIGYCSIKPEEINATDVARLIFEMKMHHIQLLRPFGLSVDIRMARATQEFESAISDLDGRIVRLESWNQDNQTGLIPGEAKLIKAELENCREQRIDKQFAFLKYLVDGGFKWIADYRDINILIDILKTKNHITDIDPVLIRKAIDSYIQKRREEHDASVYSFMPHLRFTAEGEAGDLFANELPPRKYVLDYPEQQVTAAPTSTALTRR